MLAHNFLKGLFMQKQILFTSVVETFTTLCMVQIKESF